MPNPIRVVTLLSDDVFSMICATIKTGVTPEAVTDNFHAKGIGASIDLNTGVVVDGVPKGEKILKHMKKQKKLKRN